MNLISQHIREEEKEFDEDFPPVIELLPVEYVDYLKDKGWTITSFEMENDTRIKRAIAYQDRIKSFHRSSSLSLVEKIIGQARAMKRTDETQMSADHSYDEGLEDFALLLEQGLEEVKDKKQ